MHIVVHIYSQIHMVMYIYIHMHIVVYIYSYLHIEVYIHIMRILQCLFILYVHSSNCGVYL